MHTFFRTSLHDCCNSPHAIKIIQTFSAALLATLCLNQAMAQTDTELLAFSKNPTRVASGEKLYQSVCFGCHGSNLEGGTGFNLKDAIWKHGQSPSQIFRNIRQGFPSKGMMAFQGTLDDKAIANMVAFILAKQEGFRNIKFTLYAAHTIKPEQFPSLKTLETIKQGELKKGLLDFALPETKDTGIEFTADLLVPDGTPYELLIEKVVKNDVIKIELNNKNVTEMVKAQKPLALHAGRHLFKVILFSEGRKRKPRIYLKNSKTVTGLNISSSNYLREISIDIVSENAPLVVRKKILDLPTRTIAVGLPQKVNYGFNSASCDIVGVWSGDLLNIGPNIVERGKKASLPLGTLWFDNNLSISLNINGEKPSYEFDRYSRLGIPTFHFFHDKMKFSVSSGEVKKDILELVYTTENITNQSLTLSIPPNISVDSDDGRLENQTFIVYPNKRDRFSLKITQRLKDNK